MKVLHITTQWPSETQTFVASDVRQSFELGFEVEVVALRSGKTTSREIFTLDRLRSYLSLQALTFFSRSPTVLIAAWRDGNGSPPAERLRLLGTAVQAMFTAVRLDRSGTLVHAHFASRTADLGRYLRVVAGPAVHTLIVTAHAADALIPTSRTLLKARLDAADVVISASRRVREACESVSETPTLLRYCTVDVRGCAPAPSDHRHRLVTVARLHPKKGWRVVLDAAEALAQAGMDFEWRAVGDGPLRTELQAEVAKRGLNTKVVFLGALTHHRALEEIAEAQVFVLPSVRLKSDVDGIPVAILEAMALNVPVVATTVGAISEVLTDETGYPVTADPTAVVEAALHALRGGDDCHARTVQAHQLVMRLCSPEIGRRALAQAYRARTSSS